jgi:TrmH family RNA methyltransferase
MKMKIVLVEPEGKINMGFILRLARNFNIDDICVVNPKFSISDEEVVNFAARGSELINLVKVVSSLDECVSDSEVSVCTTALYDTDSDILRQSVSLKHLVNILPTNTSVALVFGRESVGLTRDELRRCDLVMTIDIRSDYNVLNLSHAVAIVLYELSSHTHKERSVLGELYSKEGLNYIIRYVKEIATLADMVDVDVEVLFKHILNKALITKAEGKELYRFFKSIYHLLRHCYSSKHTSHT